MLSQLNFQLNDCAVIGTIILAGIATVIFYFITVCTKIELGILEELEKRGSGAQQLREAVIKKGTLHHPAAFYASLNSLVREGLINGNLYDPAAAMIGINEHYTITEDGLERLRKRKEK